MLLMELTKKVPNPIFDKRSKGGIRAVENFAAGTRFTMGGEAGGIAVNFYDLHGDGASDKQPLVIALLASSPANVQPETLAEVALTSARTFPAERVIDALLASDKLSPDAIRGAYKALGEEEDSIAASLTAGAAAKA